MRPAYVLGVLLLVHTLNFVDRNIVAIVAGDIKQEMALSDTELGILLGPDRESSLNALCSPPPDAAGAILACLGLPSRAPPPAAPRPDEVLEDSFAETD